MNPNYMDSYKRNGLLGKKLDFLNLKCPILAYVGLWMCSICLSFARQGLLIEAMQVPNSFWGILDIFPRAHVVIRSFIGGDSL